MRAGLGVGLYCAVVLCCCVVLCCVFLVFPCRSPARLVPAPHRSVTPPPLPLGGSIHAHGGSAARAAHTGMPQLRPTPPGCSSVRSAPRLGVGVAPRGSLGPVGGQSAVGLGSGGLERSGSEQNGADRRGVQRIAVGLARCWRSSWMMAAWGGTRATTIARGR